MFMDASAVCGILANEEDKDMLLARLDAATTPLTTSPVAMMESVLAVSKAKKITIDEAEELVTDFMTVLKVRNVSITPEIGKRAIRARVQYGKPHRAQLNMGDTFAYACAKNYSIPLLYKGNDFPHTDLA
ncbi:type II toxin-antitoxin system VapC family toxin (plasmid) [Microvirga sp. RSM25]|uniref:type II toxin-antitoxin system VapC family toxin n=1 Tax=Microvirga sp. RSM25 TaxID=3273802 RepID=UPI00384B3506